MEGSCARALELGLPAIAFTEHLDHTVWRIDLEGPYSDENLIAVAGPDGATMRELKLEGNRADIRSESVTSVLQLLADRLDEAASKP